MLCQQKPHACSPRGKHFPRPGPLASKLLSSGLDASYTSHSCPKCNQHLLQEPHYTLSLHLMSSWVTRMGTQGIPGPRNPFGDWVVWAGMLAGKRKDFPSLRAERPKPLGDNGREGKPDRGPIQSSGNHGKQHFISSKAPQRMSTAPGPAAECPTWSSVLKEICVRSTWGVNLWSVSKVKPWQTWE